MRDEMRTIDTLKYLEDEDFQKEVLKDKIFKTGDLDAFLKESLLKKDTQDTLNYLCEKYLDFEDYHTEPFDIVYEKLQSEIHNSSDIKEVISDIVNDMEKDELNYWNRKYNLISDKIFEKLSKNEDWMVRSILAENLNIPVYILESLSKDENYDVRTSVAKNPNTPTYILEKLAIDEDVDVRIGLAKNINTPVNILERFKHNEDARVTEQAIKNLSLRSSEVDETLNKEFNNMVKDLKKNQPKSDLVQK